MRKIRSSLSPEYRAAANQQICQLLLDFLKQRPFQAIAAFYPIKEEVDVLPALRTLNAPIALPCIRSKFLEFRQYHFDDQLVDGKFSPEPSTDVKIVLPYIIIVPLLAFNKNGDRLGYGGGFYDRTLAQPIYQSTLKIGVAYSVQECQTLAPQEHDVPLDVLITEKGIIYSQR